MIPAIRPSYILSYFFSLTAAPDPTMTPRFAPREIHLRSPITPSQVRPTTCLVSYRLSPIHDIAPDHSAQSARRSAGLSWAVCRWGAKPSVYFESAEHHHYSQTLLPWTRPAVTVQATLSTLRLWEGTSLREPVRRTSCLSSQGPGTSACDTPVCFMIGAPSRRAR